MSRKCAWRDCHRPVRAPFHLCPMHWIRLPAGARQFIEPLDLKGLTLVVSVDTANAAGDEGMVVWGARQPDGTLVILWAAPL
jgi:hypothetical protein